MGTALEGVSYVGKTTTLKRLRTLGGEKGLDVVVVPEYFQIGSLPPFGRASHNDAKKACEIILGLERKRTEYLNQALSAFPRPIVFWDRGPISCIAFEYALDRTGYYNAINYLVDLFDSEKDAGNIVLPGNFAFLFLDLDLISRREAIMLKEGHEGPIDFLRRTEVIDLQNHVFSAYMNFNPNTLGISTRSKSVDEVSGAVMQFALQSPSEEVDLQGLLRKL